MIKILITLALLFNIANAKNITPNEVYGQVMLVSDNVHHLLKHFNIKHDHDGIIKRIQIDTKLKPRNVWQKSYEIMIKLNMFRNQYNLLTIQPVNMAPVLNLNLDLVYEQTQRILTEFRIFSTRLGIQHPPYKLKAFKGKTPLDVYIGLSHISASLDELNKGGVTPSYVFGENMRVYDDLGLILDYYNIDDNTIPAKKNLDATPTDTFNTGLKILGKIKQLQISAGIDFVDFQGFKQEIQTPSDVFSITQMILAELQTIKAYAKIEMITPASSRYKTKTPSEVDQLMSWNLRKLELLKALDRR